MISTSSGSHSLTLSGPPGAPRSDPVTSRSRNGRGAESVSDLARKQFPGQAAATLGGIGFRLGTEAISRPSRRAGGAVGPRNVPRGRGEATEFRSRAEFAEFPDARRWTRYRSGSRNRARTKRRETTLEKQFAIGAIVYVGARLGRTVPFFGVVVGIARGGKFVESTDYGDDDVSLRVRAIAGGFVGETVVEIDDESRIVETIGWVASGGTFRDADGTPIPDGTTVGRVGEPIALAIVDGYGIVAGRADGAFYETSVPVAEINVYPPDYESGADAGERGSGFNVERIDDAGRIEYYSKNDNPPARVPVGVVDWLREFVAREKLTFPRDVE